MKKYQALLASLLMLTVFISCSKKEEPAAAIIEEITGEVFILKNGVRQKAVKGMKLFEGDEIITGNKSSIEISYNKNKINIYEKSKLSIKKMKLSPKTEYNESEFFLSEGRIFVDSSENTGQKNKLSVISADSTAVSTDSKFIMNKTSAETRIESKKGNIDSISSKSGKKTTIVSGQKISESKNIIILKPPVKKIVPSEFSAVKPGVELPKVK